MKRVLILLICIVTLVSSFPVTSSADNYLPRYQINIRTQADERADFFNCLQNACPYQVYDGAKTQREGQWAFYIIGHHNISDAVATAMKNAGLNYQYRIKEWANYGKQRTYVNVYLR